MPRCTRRAPGIVLVVAAGLGAAACSSTHPSAGTTSTTGASTSSTPATTSTPASTTTGGPAHCLASDLSVAVTGTQGAAGTTELTLELRNTSSAPCALKGYPGAQLYDKGGAQLPTDVVPGGSYSFTNFAPAPLTLAPGAPAWFNMAYSDVPTGSGACPTAGSMWITPPDDVDHLVVTQTFVVCNGGRLTVSPVFGQGSPETQSTAPPHP